MTIWPVIIFIEVPDLEGNIRIERIEDWSRPGPVVRIFKSLLSALPRWTTHRAREDGFTCGRWLKWGVHFI